MIAPSSRGSCDAALVGAPLIEAGLRSRIAALAVDCHKVQYGAAFAIVTPVQPMTNDPTEQCQQRCNTGEHSERRFIAEPALIRLRQRRLRTSQRACPIAAIDSRFAGPCACRCAHAASHRNCCQPQLPSALGRLRVPNRVKISLAGLLGHPGIGHRGPPLLSSRSFNPNPTEIRGGLSSRFYTLLGTLPINTH